MALLERMDLGVTPLALGVRDPRYLLHVSRNPALECLFLGSYGRYKRSLETWRPMIDAILTSLSERSS